MLKKGVQPKAINDPSVGSLVYELKSLKDEVVSTVDSKVEEVESALSTIKDTALKMQKEHEEAISAVEESTVEIIKHVRTLQKGDPGENADEEAIEKRLLNKLPKMEEIIANLPTLEEVAEKASELVKPSLKVIQESIKIEMDPEEIVPKLNVAKNKKELKLSIANIEDWNQIRKDIGAEISRSKGYVGGGGFNNIANASGVVSTGLSTLKFTGSGINSVSQSGSVVTVDISGGSGSGTVTNVATGTGLTGGPITTTGTVSLATNIAPIATLGTAGQLIRVNAGGTALEYFTAAAGGVDSVVGTTNRITVNSTDPANPIVDISSSYVGQTSITTLGTIGTGVWNGTAIALNKITALTANRAVVSDASGFLSSATTTATEIGYVNGVTSSIQTQLNGKAATLSGTANEITYFNTSSTIASLTTATYPSLTELSYVKGVTSSIQTQLNTKGSGTVTNTGGSLTANSVVLGAGTNDTKVVAGITTDGISKLNLGVPGSSVGAVVFGNATSNTITLQPVTGNLGPSVLSLPAATDTLVGRSTSDTLSNKVLSFPVIANIVNTGILTLPTSTDTLVARDTTDTLTNKSMSGSTNTFTNIPLSSAVTGTLPVANGGTGQTTYTNGQLLIGNTTGNTLTKATLTGTANQVIITNGAGSITLSIPQDIATTSNPQFATIELGNASDTTLSRSSAGVLAVEGVVIPSISSTNTLTNKTIRNTVEPGTDDTYTGEDLTGFNATATIAQWEAVYLSTTGWALTDADAASTAGGVCVGLASTSGTNGNPLTVVTRGVIRNDGWTWTTVGAPLYLSTTAGALTETAPSGTDDVVRIVGYVMSDDCIFFAPSNDWITRV